MGNNPAPVQHVGKLYPLTMGYIALCVTVILGLLLAHTL